MERVRVATAVFCVLLVARIILSVRREHIRVEYSMAWLGAAVLLLGLSLSNTALDWLSSLVGVADASFILMMIAGVLFLLTFLRFSIEVSGLKDHNIVLAQKIGMLEWEVNKQAEEIRRLQSERSNSARGPLENS